MNDEKQYTEEEVRRRERAAWLAGIERWNGKNIAATGLESLEREARHRYPITRKVERVVQVANEVWATCTDGRVHFWDSPEAVEGLDEVAPDAPLWADALLALLARPYEEIEE